MKGLLASKEVLDSIFVDESLNFKVRLDNIVLATGTTLSDIYDDEILYDGFKYDDAIGSDEKFDIIGSIIARSLTVILYNDNGKYSNYEFEGMTCRVSVSQSSTLNWFELGEFSVIDAVYSENSITLSMLGLLSKLDVPYVDSTGQYPVTLSTMLSRVQSITGESIGTAYLDADRLFVLNNYLVYNAPDPDSITCRDVVGWIAGIIGCYVTSNIYYNNGSYSYNQIHFRYPGCAMLSNSTFSQPDFLVVDENNIPHVDPRLVTSDGTEVSEVTGAEITMSAPILKSFFTESISVSDVRITGIKVVVNDLEDSNVYEYLCGTDDYCITIRDNQLITNETAQDVADFIGGNYINMTFRKCNVTHVGNILLEAGDFIYITDSKGNEHRTLITRTTIDIGKPQTIICGCEDIATNGRMISSQATKNYSAAKQKISKLREELDQLANELDQQYFWHDETGPHAGSHITHKKRADFVEDPENAGYNAHFTTTALRLRDGLTNLAEFATDHIQLGQNNEVRTYITSAEQSLLDPYGTELTHTSTYTNKNGNSPVVTETTIHPTISKVGDVYETNTLSFSVLASETAAIVPASSIVKLLSCTGTWNNVTYNFYLDEIDYEARTFKIKTKNDVGVTGRVTAFHSIDFLAHVSIYVAHVGTADNDNAGTNSVAIGTNNNSSYGASHTFGVGLEKYGDGKIAVGKFNKRNDKFEFEVGNGTSDSDRKTAFAVGTNDNAYMYVDSNAASSSMDGMLVTEIDNLEQSSYLLDTNYDGMLNLKRVYYFCLNRLRRLKNFFDVTIANNLTTNSAGAVLDARQGKALKEYVDSHGIVYWTAGRNSSTGTFNELRIYGDGRIDYIRTTRKTAVEFTSQIGTTGYYLSNLGYKINYPLIIQPGGDYELIDVPYVNVSVTNNTYDDRTIGVFGSFASSSGQDLYSSSYYKLISNSNLTATVFVNFHVIGRWH